MSYLDKYQSYLLGLLRIVAGLLFVEHGCVKLLHFPVGMQMPGGMIGNVLMVAGIIELVGGALITIGVFSRIAAFVASGEMAIAYWMVHVPKGGFWPIVNGGGEAILFCFVFLYLAAAGPGAFAANKQ
jgi:putative oxidoreductase